VAARWAAVSGPSARAILIASARYHSLASTWSWLPKETILGTSVSAGSAATAGERTARVADPEDGSDQGAHPGREREL
jgi:hypothetical protein